MKILVTGAQGQLARCLAETPFPAGVEALFAARPELDLAVPGSAASVIERLRPDAVINAAAYTAVDQAEAEPALAFRVNVAGAEEVAAAAARTGAPVIQISTDYVFDGRGERPYREDAATGPVNVYGASKLEGEDRVRAANPAHLIVRTSWVYSAFGGNFVRTMLRLAADRSELRVVGDQLGRPTSAHDLAWALADVVSRWQAGDTTGQGQTYHVAAGGQCSWAEFATEIFGNSKALGGPGASVVPIATEDYPTPASRPRYSVLDTAKFERDFGVRLPDWRVSVEGVIRRLLGGL